MARVLIVDDEAGIRSSLAGILGDEGFETTVCEDGEAALRSLARDGLPDLLLLDIAMPGRDGLSALQEMIALEPDLPVIIHTAYPTFRDDFLAWTADAYVEKSSDIAPLLTALERALSGVAVA